MSEEAAAVIAEDVEKLGELFEQFSRDPTIVFIKVGMVVLGDHAARVRGACPAYARWPAADFRHHVARGRVQSTSLEE